MKQTERITTAAVYTSEVHPLLTTEDAELGATLAWADANPQVYKVVMGKRSVPFGEDSSTWLGYQRGKEPDAVLQRLWELRRMLGGGWVIPDGIPEAWTEAYQRCLDELFWTWRARFTLAHIEDKGLKGGLFKQFDGTYDRGCMHLDYTPKTLDEVMGHFRAWCDAGPNKFPTREIRVDGKTIWRADPSSLSALTEPVPPPSASEWNDEREGEEAEEKDAECHRDTT